MYAEKQVVLGVSGGIAAYKAAALLRLLVRAGADVHVVMTQNAQEFITPLTFQTLSGNPVHTNLFNLIQEREIGHIGLADRADLVLIAPATANLIGKVASGLADDLLTTTIMATKAPVLFVPAMNTNMWENPVCQQNRAKLSDYGYHFMQPVHGELACGWQGQGKMPEPEDIFDCAQPLLGTQDLGGKTVLVTAGPTREELDPVRFLSNYSSGKMGYAVARAARNHGAKVILVSGPVHLTAPQNIETIRVQTANEMHAAVITHAKRADVVIKAAAVADYRPANRADLKTKKSQGPTSLNLVQNPDILDELGQNKQDLLLVGFAAETNDIRQNAKAKLTQKNLDLIVANDVSLDDAGFDVETNIVRFFSADGTIEDLPKMSKDEVAEALIKKLVTLMGQKPEGRSGR
ncbi:MAG: bifunctional phosphopantothenoylcysteine decarboxylase/phosphopantothenate--cysteine ligase CoaBC [Deltaproteobacteria bacterium]|jgi:phosphopantothenoylcysteine decarboxylase/phosphopantothenate--cysteine ligase|nr:bifunctional phosphopantothenoylcysteine decarboxylase/phosphopantothenate--cysteine ligase CoaBC [Deltaproteobacteria bacterium]MBW2519261.1 bifunctional phosphopantothenoylcysteine decarboxylase/phosphopantothenate--cysteine ligase CoaBC [Deltaproteobacteria bacterium]